MTDPHNPRHQRRTTAIIVGVLVLVVVAVTALGITAAGNAHSTAAGSSSAATGSSTQPSASGATLRPPATPAAPLKTATPTPLTTAPKPQETKVAAISSAAPIVKALIAEVTKMEAVQGTASGPGEIAGPSVRFTVTITNHTGKRVDLSKTVVNAYEGKDASPAVELESPGGKPFPASVADGGSVKGVFVFNIPRADRGMVEITVDSSVLNPVVAFKGSAPR